MDMGPATESPDVHTPVDPSVTQDDTGRRRPGRTTDSENVRSMTVPTWSGTPPVTDRPPYLPQFSVRSRVPGLVTSVCPYCPTSPYPTSSLPRSVPRQEQESYYFPVSNHTSSHCSPSVWRSPVVRRTPSPTPLRLYVYSAVGRRSLCFPSPDVEVVVTNYSFPSRLHVGRSTTVQVLNPVVFTLLVLVPDSIPNHTS